MKLTCITTGKSYHSPASHLLQFNGVTILLECPLDISLLRFFLPADFSPIQKKNLSSPVSRPFKIQKKDRAEHDANLCPASPFRYCNGLAFIASEPWYKTANMQLVDIASIDLVLISSPAGFLGLPYLTRDENFSAKIYATEAAAKLGRLMMDELLEMHLDFIRLYGLARSKTPLWLNFTDMEAAPLQLKENVWGKDGIDIGSWHCLYSALDVKACMDRVTLLHFAEEKSYNDMLVVKALSSGLEIGASNWIINGLTKSLAYLTGSLIASGHAMGLQIPSLKDVDVILFSDFSFLTELSDYFQTKSSYMENQASEINERLKSKYMFPASTLYDSSANTSDTTHVRSSATSVLVNPSPGKSPGMELSGASCEEAASIESSATLAGNLILAEDKEKIIHICSYVVKSIKKGGSVLIPISRFGCILQLVEEISSMLNSTDLREVPIFFISSTANETLAFANTIPEWLNTQRQEKLYAGDPLFEHTNLILEKKLHSSNVLHSQHLLQGSVLPASSTGYPVVDDPSICDILDQARINDLLVPLFESLLETVQATLGCILDSSSQSHAFQDNPYKFLHLIHNVKRNVWHEPCIVFASHWSLRAGPIVHLLHHWRQNKNCLLVILEYVADIEILLSPFKPMAMEILHCPFDYGLRINDIQQLMEQLQPKVVLFPELIRKGLQACTTKNLSMSFYFEGETLQVQDIKNDIEIEIAKDLALQLRPKESRYNKSAVAELKGELHIADGKYVLRSDNSSGALSFFRQPCIRDINPDSLLMALQAKGLSASFEVSPEEGAKNAESEILFAISVSSPYKASIEFRKSHALIRADNFSTCECVYRALHMIKQGS